MRTHDQTVLTQFDRRSQAYLTSAVHAAGPDLQQAVQQVLRLSTRNSMLDVGCGAGHLSFALAPHFSHVVATDPSPSMLITASSAAAQRGLPQMEVRQASAQHMPFPDAHFDLVASRYSAHHWNEVPLALSEMRRVLRPGGRLLMIDLLGDESPLVDTHLQAIELLRDPGHVRDYSPSQWRRLVRDAGFTLQQEFSWPTRLEFGPWVERMCTPPGNVAVIRALLAGASREVREGLAVEADGSFVPRTGLLWARVASAGAYDSADDVSRHPHQNPSPPGIWQASNAA
jgi:ubiquinone/menaquinone biosynthesis C-methylase UbiE